jgi:hypothetical protein
MKRRAGWGNRRNRCSEEWKGRSLDWRIVKKGFVISRLGQHRGLFLRSLDLLVSTPMTLLRFLTNVSAPLPYGADSKPHGLSNEAIITIVVFIFIALCILFSAIYLLIKGKNISEILEETLEDEACGNCIGIMNESVRTDDGIPDEVNALSPSLPEVLSLSSMYVTLGFLTASSKN